MDPEEPKVWKDGRLQDATHDAALASLCQAVERAVRQHQAAGVRAVILMMDQPAAPGTGGGAGPGLRRRVRVRLQPRLGLRARDLIDDCQSTRLSIGSSEHSSLLSACPRAPLLGAADGSRNGIRARSLAPTCSIW